MQLKAQKDFFIRTTTTTDQPEVIQLIQKYGAKTAASMSEEEFLNFLRAEKAIFRVILNSNGMVIGTYACAATHTGPEPIAEWKLLAMNPNFQKKEVKQALLDDVRKWAVECADGLLLLAPGMITGDWKTFVKSQGVKIESSREKTPEKIEKIIF